MRTWVRSLALFSGLRIQSCRKVWHRSQTQHGPITAVAVVQASSYSSDSTPSLETSYAALIALKKKKKKKKKLEVSDFLFIFALC